MSDPNCHDQRGHEDVWLLLPWYVNGTLETAERHLVDEHLIGCALCREELGRCRGLSAALRAGEESAPSPHPIQLARLLERVDASERGLDRGEEADRDDAGDRTARAIWTSSERAARLAQPERPDRVSRQARRQPDEQSAGQGGRGENGGHLAAGGRGAERLGGHIGRAGRAGRAGGASLFAATPRPIRIALVGQLAALLLLAAALGFRPARLVEPARSAQALGTPVAGAPAAAYHTLSASAGDTDAAVSRPQIRVVFAEAATEKQIREVLLRARGRLVDGPSPLGTYILEIPAPAARGAVDSGAQPGAAGAEPSTLPAAHALPADGAPPDSLAIVLSYLRAQAIVRFAEPVAGTSPAAGSAGATGSSATQRPPAGARTPDPGTATGGGATAAPP
jgi:hypothetical protein